MKSKKTADKPAPGKRGPKPVKGVVDIGKLEAMCAVGLTDPQICQILSISRQTLHRLKKDQKICDAIKRGKERADEKVVEALYHRACGYTHPEDDIRVVNNEIVITPTIKHYPPDTAAAFIWLKNRKPESWKDKQEVDHNIKGEVRKYVVKVPDNGRDLPE